jgi:threonine/homoserine/homoserine lactone efflux protein
MSLEVSVTFFIVIFIFAITPGPGTFALLARALASGTRACLPMSIGIAVSDIIYLILSTLGLATIAENYGGLFTAIRFIGAAYLIYLGWKMWTEKVDTNTAVNQQKNVSNTKN